MASLPRLFSVSKLISRHGSSMPVQRVFPRIGTIQPIRCISTSKKDRDVALDGQIVTPPLKSLKNVKQTVKDWQTYGFDYEDETEDLNQFHEMMFFSFSVVLVGIVAYWMYYPDYYEIDWTQREAYLQLREREAAGLPPVSRDYVDPATIKLPSEEELEAMNFEIII